MSAPSNEVAVSLREGRASEKRAELLARVLSRDTSLRDLGLQCSKEDVTVMA